MLLGTFSLSPCFSPSVYLAEVDPIEIRERRFARYGAAARSLALARNDYREPPLRN
jgi:hypothetical protein